MAKWRAVWQHSYGIAEGQALAEMAGISFKILCKLKRKMGNYGCVQMVTLQRGNDVPCVEINLISINVPII